MQDYKITYFIKHSEPLGPPKKWINRNENNSDFFFKKKIAELIKHFMIVN